MMKHFSDLSMQLTKDLYMIQQKQTPITMNSLITSSLVFYSENEISFKSIKIRCKNIYDHIQRQKYLTYISGPPTNYDIDQAVNHLGLKVRGKPMDKLKGDEA